MRPVLGAWIRGRLSPTLRVALGRCGRLPSRRMRRFMRLNMSDNWLMFIPADPNVLPTTGAAENAAQLLKTFLPDAYGEVSAQFSEQMEFHNGGANWSGVKCAECGANVDEWWGDAMDRAWKSRFENLGAVTPCCGHATTLNDLNYVWPAGFSRFVLKAMNPNIRQTTSEQDEALSRALGFALRKVWMHI